MVITILLLLLLVNIVLDVLQLIFHWLNYHFFYRKPYSLTVITILLVIIVLDILQLQGFQFIFSNVPVRHYLQAVLYGTLKYEHFHEFLKLFKIRRYHIPF